MVIERTRLEVPQHVQLAGFRGEDDAVDAVQRPRRAARDRALATEPSSESELEQGHGVDESFVVHARRALARGEARGLRVGEDGRRLREERARGAVEAGEDVVVRVAVLLREDLDERARGARGPRRRRRVASSLARRRRRRRRRHSFSFDAKARRRRARVARSRAFERWEEARDRDRRACARRRGRAREGVARAGEGTRAAGGVARSEEKFSTTGAPSPQICENFGFFFSPLPRGRERAAMKVVDV